MKYSILLILLIVQQAYAQTFKEQELKTELNEVTIYINSGLVTRTGEAEISAGKTLLKVKSLSPYIDEKSIQVKAKGNFTILSVNHKLNYLDQLKKDERINDLREKIKSFQNDISEKNNRLLILAEKQSLLNENKNLNGTNTAATLNQIKEAIDFYDRELTAIKSEELSIKNRIKEIEEEKGRLEKEIATEQNKKDLPTSEIAIRLETDKPIKGSFELTYLVGNTGWYPKYDVRVESVEKPLSLRYKADIYQNTGVDWENVKLRLSNGDPNKSGVAPQLNTWFLNYARHTIINNQNFYGINKDIREVSGKIVDENGEALPGVNVLVKGTTIGTTTDLDGNYSLTLPNNARYLKISYIGYENQELAITSSNLSTKLTPDYEQLEEIVVVAYGLEGRAAGVSRNSRTNSLRKEKADVITTTTIENQTTVEFEVDEPYSINSNGEKLSVDLKQFEIETLYEYYAVPKLDKDAFLIARIINWDKYNLLEGEANLYLEDTYVGRSILDASSLSDTLDISLGRDKSVVIGREKIDEFSKRKTIGSNKIESREFKITVRNKKSEAIQLTLFDQMPVSVNNDITVTPTKLANGVYNEKTGEIKWKLDVKPQQQFEFDFGYEVKFPKKEKVLLE